MFNYWIPKTKQQLINWIHTYYPDWKLKNRTLKELYAIFYAIQDKLNRGIFVGIYAK